MRQPLLQGILWFRGVHPSVPEGFNPMIDRFAVGGEQCHVSIIARLESEEIVSIEQTLVGPVARRHCRSDRS